MATKSVIYNLSGCFHNRNFFLFLTLYFLYFLLNLLLFFFLHLLILLLFLAHPKLPLQHFPSFFAFLPHLSHKVRHSFYHLPFVCARRFFYLFFFSEEFIFPQFYLLSAFSLNIHFLLNSLELGDDLVLLQWFSFLATKNTIFHQS